MVLDPDAAYLAVKARDARFDGRLFVGVPEVEWPLHTPDPE